MNLDKLIVGVALIACIICIAVRPGDSTLRDLALMLGGGLVGATLPQTGTLGDLLQGAADRRTAARQQAEDTRRKLVEAEARRLGIVPPGPTAVSPSTGAGE